MPTGTGLDDTAASGATSSWTGNLTYGKYFACDSYYWVKEGSLGAKVEFLGHTPATSGAGSELVNGAVLGSVVVTNPRGTSGFYQPFDGRGPSFRESMKVEYPISVAAGDTLIVAVSAVPPLGSGGHVRFVQKYLYIHVIAADEDDPAADAFAPPYFPLPEGVEFDLPDFGDLDVATLLPATGVTPPSNMPAIADIELSVSKIPMEIDYLWTNSKLRAFYDQVNYGQLTANTLSIAMCLTAAIDSDDTDRDTPGATATTRRNQLFANLLQIAICVAGAAANGKRWINNGAQDCMWAFLVRWAGKMLNIPWMRDLPFLDPRGLPYFAEEGKCWFVGPGDVGRDILVRRFGFAQAGTSNTLTLDADHPSTIPGNSASSFRKYRQLVDRHLHILDEEGEIVESHVITNNLDGTGNVVTIDDTFSTTVEDGTPYLIDSYIEADIGTPEQGITHSTFPENDNPSRDSEYRARAHNCSMGMVLCVGIADMTAGWPHPAIIGYHNRNYVDSLHFENADADNAPIPAFCKALIEDLWETYVTSPTAGKIDPRIWPLEEA